MTTAPTFGSDWPRKRRCEMDPSHFPYCPCLVQSCVLSEKRQEVDNQNWDVVLNNSRKTYKLINRLSLRLHSPFW